VNQNSEETAERILANIILGTSSTMIGVCAGIISVIKIFERDAGPSHVDEYSSIVLVFFLVAAIVSYLSIRHSDKQHFSARLELVADIAFLAGLVGIAVIGVFFAYEII
jgi:hypothetical protein